MATDWGNKRGAPFEFELVWEAERVFQIPALSSTFKRRSGAQTSVVFETYILNTIHWEN